MAVKRNLHRYYACDWRNLPEHRAITAWQASHVTGVLEGWRKQSNAHPEHHSALVTPIQMPITKLRVAEFLSKGQRRSFANRILCYIYICIYMCMYVHVCTFLQGMLYGMLCPWLTSDRAAGRAWLHLPGTRKPPAFSAELVFTEDCPWKRWGSIRIVNLVIELCYDWAGVTETFFL